ncbi:MAG: hypothetical protein KUA35_14190 [Pseudodesulfovibrio sp.]|uniref:Uncharacterized protein n=1 Tax=Pseudodesulfovibrio aespoeensis (strain ATCC 700646 / DSM 10631 / Aspo-2) TaxID=643562 RepID=E6VYD2_PSEA9|nr:MULTISPECIES: DUF1302 family protein [Pseudodesulfovibrio]MBU4474458.1 hypothetical protein [Pseudomonadota bacterium]ADU61590.1 hypothetical protein Daes_0571 [Pseudodesulfovibrio aespoeensis Aspo-2]MBU4516091.1 hypothetical protein [Pseudomonadota bacterium]MBU4521961.1 hypothetical protein [Pseudomonadota bacterium]MBU4558389.1 hypothetical protein [Pseudomonadota bacterium]
MGRLFAAVVLIILLAGAEAMAAEVPEWLERVALSGWIEGVQSAAVKAPHDPVTSRARMRLIAEADWDAVYANVSVDAEKNWKIDGQKALSLHEGWLEHVGQGWDVRLGRQTIIWGRADGVQITDVICPPDYTESITRDLDEIRIPVEAAKVRLLGSSMDLEMIWIPVFQSATLPGRDNPWGSETSWPAGMTVVQNDTKKPDLSLGNSEVAMKLAAYRSGYDMSASVFYTWDDFAANHRTVSTVGPSSVEFSPRYHRMTVLGLDFARPWSDFVFRFETAGYLGRYFETRQLAIDPKRKNSVKWLGGMDWTPGGDWSVIAQLYGEHLLNHESCLVAERDEVSTTLHVSKKVLRQTLTLSGMVYYSVNDQDTFFRAKADYEWSDGLHFLVGADLFNGRHSGSYGRYEDNSQLWVKVKYSF